MFKCEATKTQTNPNEAAHRLVTHVRNRTYTRRNYKTGQDEIVGHGTEVAREILVCKSYYEQVMADGFKPQVVKEKE